jgi:hypothetical protein
MPSTWAVRDWTFTSRAACSGMSSGNKGHVLHPPEERLPEEQLTAQR